MFVLVGFIQEVQLENDKVEAIIVLPRDMFYTTDISVTLWILNNNKKERVLNGRHLRDRTNEILFVDLRRWDENIEECVIDKGKKKKKIVLTPSQIERVKKIYNDWQSTECRDSSLYEVPELYRSIKIWNSQLTDKEKADNVPTIESQNYSLLPSKYIRFIDHDLEIDFKKEMERIQREMKVVLAEEINSQSMMKDAFDGIGYGIKDDKTDRTYQRA